MHCTSNLCTHLNLKRMFLKKSEDRRSRNTTKKSCAVSFKRAFFFYHQQCFKILQACQTSFQGLLHFLGTCWNKYLWGLFAIAIIPQDIINYYQYYYYYYYYYLTRCEQKAYVQNLKMLSQGQLDVLHLEHFNFFIKQINSFQTED